MINYFHILFWGTKYLYWLSCFSIFSGCCTSGNGERSRLGMWSQQRDVNSDSLLIVGGTHQIVTIWYWNGTLLKKHRFIDPAVWLHFMCWFWVLSHHAKHQARIWSTNPERFFFTGAGHRWINKVQCRFYPESIHGHSPITYDSRYTLSLYIYIL